jgi:hypothetical protein
LNISACGRYFWREIKRKETKLESTHVKKKILFWFFSSHFILNNKKMAQEKEAIAKCVKIYVKCGVFLRVHCRHKIISSFQTALFCIFLLASISILKFVKILIRFTMSFNVFIKIFVVSSSLIILRVMNLRLFDLMR